MSGSAHRWRPELALNPIATYETTERDGRIFVTGPTDAVSSNRTPAFVSGLDGDRRFRGAAEEQLRSDGYESPISQLQGPRRSPTEFDSRR